jgi:galactonate dehydratase
MRLSDLDVLVVGNPPPGNGGRYFQFVKLTTACGIVGWGEVYAAAVGPEAMRLVIQDVFARHMEGENPANIELMYRRVYSSGFTARPDPTAMGAFAGLEIACWDILGKALDRPVHALWGGRLNARLRAYTYLYPAEGEVDAAFYNDPDLSAAAAERAVAAGWTAVKFDPSGPYTIQGPRQPAPRELDRSAAFCARIREAVGDRADLLFGTHGQFTASGAIRLAHLLAPHAPLWFEEPVPPGDPDAMATVARASPVPIAAGERLTTPDEFAALLRRGAASILQPNMGRVGGLLAARKVAILAESHGAQVAPHNYAGPLIWAAGIQLAATIPNFLILETVETPFQTALMDPPIPVEAGFVTPPDRPGLGTAIDEAFARAHPYEGSRLHLQMQEDPPHPLGDDRFAGGW